MQTSDFSAYASVVLDQSLDRLLDYGILPEQLENIRPGCRVEVPLKNRIKSGFVFEIKTKPDFLPVKPLHRILSDSLIPTDLLQLASWMMRYYCSPLSAILRIILPPSIRKLMQPKEQLLVMRNKTKEELCDFCIQWRLKRPKQVIIIESMLKVTKGILLTQLLEETKGTRATVKALQEQGLISLESVHVDRSPLVDEEYFTSKAKVLNLEQAEALKKIDLSLEKQQFQTHLLHGVTGSGKTEVYLQAIEKALSMGKGSIMLVPEISLTAQTIERFKSRFREKIAILHHRLSDGERNDEWHHIKNGRAKIVIGARSAIFSPVVDLGLIIIDEEHEQSYKQSDVHPAYQGRDVAVMRGKITNSTVVLGSATPSFESYFNAKNGKYLLSELNHRAASQLPSVTIIDMKREYEKAKGFTNFSDTLLNGIKKRQESGEQTLLFLNRRGYHTVLLCPECQHSIKCNHCDVPMTFHMSEQHLNCHLCAFQLSPPSQCPTCKKQTPLKFRGVGTELIEKSLQAILPEIRTLRLDADTTKHKGSHQKLLKDFKAGKADVLIGTQMIAKGLHMPQVTLVGVLNSDASLNIPDFRASEVAFQLITQVAGRSGRGSSPGEVIIQTLSPNNSTIGHASKLEFKAFYDEEIAIRELFGYPPFTQIAKIVFSGKEPNRTLSIAEGVRERLIANLPTHYRLHPVQPCGYTKVKDHYRYQFLLIANSLSNFNHYLENLKKNYSIPKEIKMFVDINPSSTYF